MRSSVIITSVLVLFISLGIYWFPDQMLSPGPLVKGHQSETQKCLSCHRPFSGAGNCEKCHSQDKFRKKPVVKGPQHMNLPPQTCLMCHSEHQKHHVPHFSHKILKQKLNKNCLGCHAWPQDQSHALMSAQCSRCHGQERFKPTIFRHKDWFKRDKRHLARCEVCHQSKNFVEYTCVSCHIHQSQPMLEKHHDEGVTDLSDCIGCHLSSHKYDTQMKRRRKIPSWYTNEAPKTYDPQEALEKVKIPWK